MIQRQDEGLLVMPMNSNKDPLRLLIYTACYNILDGVVLTIRKIEKQVLSEGGSVLILTTRSGDSSHTDLNGFHHPNRQVLFIENALPIPFHEHFLGLSLDRTTEKQLDEFSPDIIHITSPDFMANSLVQYARNREIPLMGTYHSNIAEYTEHYPFLVFAKPTVIVIFAHIYNFLQRMYVPTPYTKQFIEESYGYDKCTNIAVCGRGVDLDAFSPQHRSEKFRKSLGLTDQDVLITFVGRLVNEKRVDIFIKVIQKLYQKGIKYHALVIGVGEMSSQIESLPKTTFAGWLSGHDLAVAYASSDIFLFPSGVETFGNVTLEAAASGLPLVVEQNCSGHLVDHGVNGFGCPDGNAESYYEATLTLCLDHEKRKAFSKESRQLIAQQYEKSMVLKQMVSNYHDVIDEFYTKYGGSHRNRDEEWSRITEGSFATGQKPRAFPILLCELFISFVITILHRMSILFITVQNYSLSRIPDVNMNESTHNSKKDGDIETPAISYSDLDDTAVCLNDLSFLRPYLLFSGTTLTKTGVLLVRICSATQLFIERPIQTICTKIERRTVSRKSPCSVLAMGTTSIYEEKDS